MKFNNFNKIGDTTYRVKNQIPAYIDFTKWYINHWNKNQKEPNDVDFRQWVRDTKYSYKYNSRDKIKDRIKFLKPSAKTKFKLFKKNISCNTFDLNIDLSNSNNLLNDIVNNLSNFEVLSKNDEKGSYETCLAFNKMLWFMIENPTLNDAKRIFFAFATYEESDDFKKIYFQHIDCLVNKMLVKYGPKQILLDGLKQQKKPKELKIVCEMIVNQKTSFFISNEDFDYLKKHKYLCSNIKTKNDFQNFIKNNSLEEITKKLLYERFNKLLNGDYFDLFTRIMNDLGLSNTTGKKTNKFNNEKVSFNNILKKFYIKLKFSKSLPYTYTQVSNYLKNIDEKNFEFMKFDKHLNGLKRYLVTEYFVNLKIFLLLKKPICQINDCINTILNENLYPVCHAPGKKCDMVVEYDTNKLISFETTINNSDRTIIMKELYPCFNHMACHKPPFEINILFLILLSDAKNKFIENSFSDTKRSWEEKTGRKFFPKVLSIAELLKINDIKDLLH